MSRRGIQELKTQKVTTLSNLLMLHADYGLTIQKMNSDEQRGSEKGKGLSTIIKIKMKATS